MSELPFEPSCYFDCEEEPSMHVTFRSGHEGFLCTDHYDRACEHDQLTEIRLAVTGVTRIIKRYDEAYGLPITEI